MLTRAVISSPAAVEEERAAAAQDSAKNPIESAMSPQKQQADGPSPLPPRPPQAHHHTTAYQPQHSDRVAALLMPASTIEDAAAAAAAAAASGSHAHMMAGLREGGAVVSDSTLLNNDMTAGIASSVTHPPGAELSGNARGSSALKPQKGQTAKKLDMNVDGHGGGASTSAAAGVADVKKRSSYASPSNGGELVAGLRLKPLSLSSRDHRDGWLHMEPSVRQAAAAAVAGASIGRRGVGVSASPGLAASEIPESSELVASPQRRLDSARSSENLESILSPSVRSVTNSPRHYTPSMRSGTNTPSFGASQAEFAVDQAVLEAWDHLRRSRVMFRGRPVGTIAAMDSSEAALNYDQVFVRDFIPSALAFLMNGEPDIVRNFLLKTLRLQSWEKRVDVFTLGEGVMPASFKVLHDPKRNMDTMVADFGESAIGRVAPVDSGFWWIILLRAYVKSTGDTALAESPDCQRGMRLILNLCLADGFDTFPTLLCADGCCMIDRRMGIYGYPIEIQSLFYMALRIARGLLRPDINGNKELLERIDKRLLALSYHMRTYFWLDHEQLNNIYRYKTEEYSHTAVNKFNVIPDSIPDWVFDFMPMKGGYFVGNVSPARMDFRWFAVGNCMAILSSLATREQACAIMDLIEERWDELMGDMPLKVAYPALENHEWRITTGCDPKNTRWSYHNGGSWPVLLWMLTAAAIKVGRPHVARKAIETAEMRLSRDSWPEYYDGKLGRYVGKQARKLQTWSIAGFLVSKMLLEDPSHLGMVALEEERKLQYPTLARSQSWRY